MSSTAQTQTYLTRDFGRTKRLVAEAILAHPGTTLAELETLTGLASKSVTGRVGDLKKEGCLTTVDDPAGERLYFDRDRTRWQPRAAPSDPALTPAPNPIFRLLAKSIAAQIVRHAPQDRPDLREKKPEGAEQLVDGRAAPHQLRVRR